MTAGSGLAGGASSGAAALALAPGYSLPQSCDAGDLAEPDGAGGWQCVPGPSSINVDIAGTAGVQTTDVALPGSFVLQFACGASGSFAAFGLAAESGLGFADANYTVTLQDDTEPGAAHISAGGVGLPQGAIETVIQGATSSDVQRAEGQIILHIANHVTAVTLHAVSNPTTGRCQLTGVATPTF